MKQISPTQTAVPIIGLNENGSSGPFLGSASFISEKNYLLTCAHVVNQWAGAYGFFLPYSKKDSIFEAKLIKTDNSRDLACLHAKDYVPPHSFPLFDKDVNDAISLVCTLDYGPTVVAGREINFSATTQLGNITRIRNMTNFYRKGGADMLELSFPALKGASGAPVVLAHHPFPLLGVIAANVDTELLPAQIETILDPKGNIEEQRRYFLPRALAINVQQVKEFLAEINE